MTIDTFYAEDRKRLCDACGKEDYLICITYPLANLFKGMPGRRTAVWFCKDCMKELVDNTINLAGEHGDADTVEADTDGRGGEKTE